MRLIWIAGLIGYAVLIFYLSGQESIPAPHLFRHQDKAMHIAEYIPFGYLSLRSFAPASLTGYAASIGLSLAYAASDEVHQSFVPGREASIADFLADAMGILGSYFIYRNTTSGR